MKFSLTVSLALVCMALVGKCNVAASDSSSFKPESKQDQLPVVIQGTHNAYESIRSGKGRVVIQRTTYHPDDTVVQKLEMQNDVVFSGIKFKDAEKITILENNPLPDIKDKFPVGYIMELHLSDDGIQIVSFRPEKGGYSAIVASDFDNLRRVAVTNWYAACMKFNRGIIDLSKFGADRLKYDTVTSPVIIGREIIDGDECIVVEGTLTGLEGGYREIMQYWVNPNKGFVIPRTRIWNDGPPPYKERTLSGECNTQFRQYADGVWAQTKDIRDDYNYDPKTSVRRISMHVETTYDPDFHINIPVSDDDLKLVLPSGTAVTDHIRDAKYTMP